MHEACAIVDDVILSDPDSTFKARLVKLRSIDYLRREERKGLPNTRLEAPILASEDCSETLLDVIPFENFNERKTALQDAQRQLIFNLVDGSDERTKKIVQTFLTIDKPTIRNVAKHLGLNKTQVIRCLRRIQREYDKDKHGNITDYLYA